MPGVSQKELADHLGLTTRQVRNLTDEGVLTREVRSGKPSYPVAENLQRYVDWKVRQARPTTFDEARLRKMLAEAEEAELKLAHARGRMLLVDDAAAELERILSALRAGLVSLPAAWADRLGSCTSTPERQIMLQTAVGELMPLLKAAVINDEAAA
jgi:transcriptional regulator